MKIIHVITTLQRGGAEKQLMTLVRLQSRLGHNILVIPLKGAVELVEFRKLENVIVLETLLNQNFCKQILILKKLLRLELPNIVHLHLPRSEVLYSITSSIFGKSSSLGVVATRHNSETFFPNHNIFASRLLSRFVARRIDKYIAISSAVLKFLKDASELPETCPIEIVHYGVNLASSNSWKVPSSSQIGVVPHRIFLFLGRFEPQKNLEFLIDVFQKHVEFFPNDYLHLYGEGSLLEILRRNTLRNVEFFSKVTDVEEVMRNHDCLILPSKYEGFGLVLLEAMQIGMPIIASNNSAIPEVLGHDYPGLFDLSSKQSLMNRLLEAHDIETLRDWSKSSFDRSTQFDDNIMLEKVMRIYEEITR